MTHGSLFSGIGGIDLGFEWAGIETKWQVEIDDYCQKLLSLRFPHTKKFTDVRKVGSHNLEKVDIISGGFPCQDISVAGKGAGLEGERSGLWTELHRVIGELRPRFAFIENVPMLTIRGGTRVIADLTEIGYDAEWQIVGADDVGAWHRRKRIWIVAYSGDSTNTTIERQEKKENRISKEYRQKRRSGMSTRTSINGEIPSEDVPNTTEDVRDSERTGLKSGIHGQRKEQFGRTDTRGSECGGEWWAVEPNVGRVANGIPKRVDRLKGIGNAVVPHIPYIIGKRLKELCQENQAEKH